MLSTQLCPYCSHRLLRHVSGRKLYWRCSHCREELPNLNLPLEFQLNPTPAFLDMESMPLEMRVLEAVG